MRINRVLSLLFLAAVPGAGAAAAAELNLTEPPFSAVSISSGLSATVQVGPVQSVRAEGPNAAAFDRLKAKVSDGTLSLWIEGNVVSWFFTFGQQKPLVVTITTPELKSADANSGATVDVAGFTGDTVSVSASSGATMSAALAATQRANVDVSSGAHLKLTGACDQMLANVSSGASLEAGAVPCKGINANVSSGGSASVNATDSVNADASIGGSITIRGRPQKTLTNSSVGGSVSLTP